MNVRPILVLVAACAFAAPTAAQQGSTEIRGQVVDEQGAVLPGVSVTVRNQETGMFRETVSNTEGTYFISGVTPGQYEITAQLEGFKRYQRRDVSLAIGRTSTVDIRLEVGALEDAITVTAETPLVDVTSKEVGGNITSRELVALPSINRNYIGFIGLLPGVIPNISTESFGSDSINVNGQDARNNNYMLDGANNNDDVIGQRAGTQARTPLEAIQEFQVLTSQFDAEFGRTTGAIVNAITKQGTNAFRGSLFEYFQDARLTERDYFASKEGLPKPDTQHQQFGGTLGGPIIRDKAHFFTSIERVLVDEGITVNIPARPELNATTTEATRVWNTLLRFDHQLNANTTWGVRWLREASPQFNQIITPPLVTLAASREEDDVDQTVVGTLSTVLGNASVNTFRLAWTQEDVAFANPCFNGNGQRQDLCDPTLAFQTFDDQQSDVAQARVNDAVQIEDTLSWFVPGWHGDHDIKVGMQYQYSSNDFVSQDNFNGTFTFGGNDAFDAANPASYPERFSIRVPGPLTYFMKAHHFGAFVQDKWKVSDRLTLSVGARYDLEVIPLREEANPAFTDVDDYPVDTNNLAPRVGLTYDLSGDGRSVVRGGYGLFYDKTHFELITALIASGVFSNSFVAQFPANQADPGPAAGELPTDAFLRQGPVVDRDRLQALFPPGSRLQNAGNVFLDNPDRHIPFTHQLSAGYERQLWSSVSLSLDYVHAFGRAQFMTQDLNPPERLGEGRTDPVVRPNPEFRQAVFTRINAGETDYDALQLQLEKRFAQSFSSRVAYTLAYSRGNTSGVGIPTSSFQLADDLRLDRNTGPTDIDRRHNFVWSGDVFVPRTGGLTFSWVARALSGLPFTIIDTDVDPDRNGILFDPLAAGAYSGEGEDAFDVEFDGGRNGARGPGFFQLDVRWGYKFRVGDSRALDLFVDVFNLTNRSNFDNPDGDRRSVDFLRLTELRQGGVPRTLQLGARLQF
ncbi:MAG: TonB-dependent receptor plug domain-containing protein [Luteitalea sp.]|nr:TonB-dependent receptor plug domain-containing protein [Luteitalea sp.]